MRFLISMCFCVLLLVSCRYSDMGANAAQTKMANAMQEQNDILREQNAQMKRIADALERRNEIESSKR